MDNISFGRITEEMNLWDHYLCQSDDSLPLHEKTMIAVEDDVSEKEEELDTDVQCNYSSYGSPLRLEESDSNSDAGPSRAHSTIGEGSDVELDLGDLSGVPKLGTPPKVVYPKAVSASTSTSVQNKTAHTTKRRYELVRCENPWLISTRQSKRQKL